MIFVNIIYLFIINNLNSFLSISYTKVFIKDIFFLLFTTTLPYFLFEYISKLSTNFLVNKICYNLYFYLYFLPSNILVYIFHINKLDKLLQIKNNKKNNPNNTYLVIFNILLYFCLFIVSNLSNYVKFLYYILDSFSYSIYFSDISYQYINCKELEYNNKIDFYNNNKLLFIFLGIFISFIISNSNPKFYLLTSYITISFIQNILIDLKYYKNNYKKEFGNAIINIFFLFEYFINYLLFIIINVILTILMVREPITIWI
jgi:hypothetical protein